jgi:hypothetical protein
MAILVLTFLLTARMEVVAQTSTNGQFQILSLQPIFDPIAGSNAYVITWNAATGRVNNVTYTDSLGAPRQNLVGFFPTYRPATMTATDYPSAGITQRFYQVKANIRPSVIMSLVLDRSSDMLVYGETEILIPAVTNFISLFNNMTDYAAQVSFSSAASVDVPMEQPFITNIQNAALALDFGGYSCVDQGLTNALAQNNTVTTLPGQNVVKVIVLFTDGLANTFNYVFNCGPRNISYLDGLFDPATGNSASSDCTIPAMLSSIDPFTGTIISNAVSSTSCVAMHNEAENRAERIAYLARSQGNTIFCIGLGNPSAPGECNGAFPVLNPTFLEEIANTADSPTYNPSQPSGLSVIATNAAQLNAAVQSLALQVFSQ